MKDGSLPKRAKTGGRLKGTENKATAGIRDLFKTLVESNLEKLEDDIRGLKPVERVKYTLEMAKFCIPTLKSVDYKGDIVITAQRRVAFIDKTKEPQTIIVEVVKKEVDFLPPTNDNPF